MPGRKLSAAKPREQQTINVVATFREAGAKVDAPRQNKKKLSDEHRFWLTVRAATNADGRGKRN